MKGPPPEITETSNNGVGIAALIVAITGLVLGLSGFVLSIVNAVRISKLHGRLKKNNSIGCETCPSCDKIKRIQRIIDEEDSGGDKKIEKEN